MKKIFLNVIATVIVFGMFIPHINAAWVDNSDGTMEYGGTIINDSGHIQMNVSNDSGSG